MGQKAVCMKYNIKHLVAAVLLGILALSCSNGGSPLNAQELGIRLLPPVIANTGQFDPDIRFVVPGPNGCVTFGKDEITITSIVREDSGHPLPDHAKSLTLYQQESVRERRSLPEDAPIFQQTRVSIVDADPDVRLEGIYPDKAKARFLIGDDKDKWTENAESFGGLAYFDLWPGISLFIAQEGGKFICSSQAANNADLEDARFELTHRKVSESTGMSAMAQADISVLNDLFSRVLNEGWSLSEGLRLMADRQGARFLAGTACFPKSRDSFIARIEASGTLSWITFLGGYEDDTGRAAAVDAYGTAYITGCTRSRDFPSTDDAHKRKHNGSQDYFTARVSASDGTLAYSSYLGIGGGGLDEKPMKEPAKLLAVIVDDVKHEDEIRNFLSLGIPMTFALMPWVTADCIDEIKSTDSAAFLHAPMEALGSRYGRSPEITVDHTADGVADLLEEWLKQTPGVVGINNHRGSRATSDPETMKRVLSVVKKHNLLFVDSHTSPVSVAVNIGRGMDVPCLQQDIFLDDREVSGVRERILAMAELAERTGYSACICHIGQPAVPDAFRQLIPELQSRGFRFVTVPDLYKAVNPKWKDVP